MKYITKLYSKIYKIIKRTYLDYRRELIEYNKDVERIFKGNKIMIEYFRKDRVKNFKCFILEQIKLFFKF